MHDVSLVDVTGNHRLISTIETSTIETTRGLQWLSRDDWFRIRFDSTKITVLGDSEVEAKTIGIPDESYNLVSSDCECMVNWTKCLPDRRARDLQESTHVE